MVFYILPPVLFGAVAVTFFRFGLKGAEQDAKDRLAAAAVGATVAWTVCSVIALGFVSAAAVGGPEAQLSAAVFVFAALGVAMQVWPGFFRVFRHLGLSEEMRTRIDDPASAVYVRRGMMLVGLYSQALAFYAFCVLRGWL